MAKFIRNDRTTLYILVGLLVIIGGTQAYNMFGFPYYHDDEGTYLASGWSLATTGELSPYTYAYDVPPAGSLLLAAWTVFTGGVSAFGFALNSGRVLMLLLHVATVGLLFLTALKLAKSYLVAVLAALIFALSPLTTSVQRLVAPENIMIMWLLLAVFLVLGDDRTLRHYMASAFAFGVAVVTHVGAIYFLPVLVYIVVTRSHPYHRRFALGLWLTLALLIVSFYPMYAQMKEELFPQGWLLSGDFPHVSLLERIADRGPDTGRFLNYGSGLGDSIPEWIDLDKPATDPVLIFGGLVAGLFIFLMSLDNARLRLVWLLMLSAVAKLVFGGPIYKIDIIILLPWLALAVAIVAGRLYDTLNNSLAASAWKPVLAAAGLAVVLYPFWSFDASRLDVYTQDQVDGQLAAVEWVRDYLPEEAVIATDNYAFVGLRDTHPNVHSYWRVDTDPAVKFTLLNDDQCSVDFAVITTQVFTDTDLFKLDLMRRIIANSDVVATYDNNGWPVEIRQVRKTFCLTPDVPAEDNAVNLIAQ